MSVEQIPRYSSRPESHRRPPDVPEKEATGNVLSWQICAPASTLKSGGHKRALDNGQTTALKRQPVAERVGMFQPSSLLFPFL